MKIFSIITKTGRVDFPIKDSESTNAEQVMKNPLSDITEKIREMNDLSNRLTKAELQDLANKVEKIEFVDVDGHTISLIKAVPPKPSEDKSLEEHRVSGAHRTPPAGYPTDKSKYADPNNYKYPIDTEEHVRAALSYFGQHGKSSGYTPEEQKTILGRIHAAAKTHGIEISKDDSVVDELHHAANEVEKGGPGSGRHPEGGEEKTTKEPNIEYVSGHKEEFPDEIPPEENKPLARKSLDNLRNVAGKVTKNKNKE